ncbi:hypothetical protein ACE1TI_21195 [Alteribacillus sp. JSM 102045]|uniref:hypothetical protein n=1 Tax=Alteribacillus sp. JSM 102045 TaxID=1562101 RepID=UPI0035C16297
MGVIRTDKWLLDWYDEPIKICEQLKTNLMVFTPFEIYQYFTLHGMYRRTLQEGNERIRNLQKNKVWEKEKQQIGVT